MKWFYNFRIGTKLLTGFAFVAVIAAGIGTLGIYHLKDIAWRDSEMYAQDAMGLRALGDLGIGFYKSRGILMRMSLTSDHGKLERFRKDYDAQMKIMRSAEEMYDKTIRTEGGRKLFNEFKSSFATYTPLRDEFIKLCFDNRGQDALALMAAQGQAAVDNLDKVLVALQERKATNAQKKAESNAAQASSASTMMIATVGIGVVLAVALGFFIARMVSKPIKQLALQAQIVAHGDLTVDVALRSNDEVGELAGSFRTMVENLRLTIGQVGEASAAVASASSEISSSTEEMAAGAQEQTNQAGEVASAVEEMAKGIVENSRNAATAAETAKEAKAASEQGGKVVAETVAGMRDIAEVVRNSATTIQELGKSTEQIGEIVGVIDDIADQTNLLALNAAIEAARAGEQGRGFAVVADEVRKLAERTTKATKEIAGMISKIQTETRGAVASMEKGTKKVDEGIVMADKAGGSLNELTSISQRVTAMVNQIASASEEQSGVSEVISKNVEAISIVTSETAQGVAQIARAADDLNRLTENLQVLLGKFTLINDVQREFKKSPHIVSKEKVPMLHNMALEEELV